VKPTTYELALRILEFRARSEAELRRKLVAKGRSQTDVNEVIGRLRDQKILDDAAFARQFARTKLLSAGTSKRRVLQQLAQKGVRRDVADQALVELHEDEGVDDSKGIRRVAEKKWKSLGKLDDFTRRRRLYAFLARRGFDADEIRDVMSALGDDIEP
jgi:regulatory protein